MRYVLGIFAVVVLGAVVPPAIASGSDLSSYRWKNRLLLVFSPTASETGFTAFNRSLSMERSGVADRDLIVFRIFEREPSFVAQQPLPPEDAEMLRRRFNAAAGRLTVVLIGKDGGVKLVRERQAALGEIFDRIDSMPMRQQEMREKGTTR